MPTVAQNNKIVSPKDITTLQNMPDTSRYKPKGIDHKKTIALHQQGLSTTQIGKIQGCTHSNVIDVLRRYELDSNNVEQYKSNRADIFAGLQNKLIAYHLTDERIKSMPPTIAPLWFNSLYNNERLERNQSTGNLSVIQSTMQEIKQLQAED